MHESKALNTTHVVSIASDLLVGLAWIVERRLASIERAVSPGWFASIIVTEAYMYLLGLMGSRYIGRRPVVAWKA